jgi:hypothetical protein
VAKAQYKNQSIQDCQYKPCTTTTWRLTTATAKVPFCIMSIIRGIIGRELLEDVKCSRDESSREMREGRDKKVVTAKLEESQSSRTGCLMRIALRPQIYTYKRLHPRVNASLSFVIVLILEGNTMMEVGCMPCITHTPQRGLLYCHWPLLRANRCYC